MRTDVRLVQNEEGVYEDIPVPADTEVYQTFQQPGAEAGGDEWRSFGWVVF